MHRRLPLLFLLCSSVFLPLLAPAGARAQTLAARPAVFADPVKRTVPSRGELVLGRTTLVSARRIFAVELATDSIMVSRGNAGNPAPLRTPTTWEAGGALIEPRFSLDLGPERYRLYFDANARLVAAITRHLPRPLTGVELAVHYPSLRLNRRWRSGTVPSFQAYSVALSDCVVLSAHVRADDQVEQLGYLFTCPTAPSVQPNGR
jgi:hypothetical protein